MAAKLSLSRQVGFLTLGNFVSQGIGLAVSMIVARFITKEWYGTYQQVILFDHFTTQMLAGSIGGSARYFFARNSLDDRNTNITSVLWLLFGGGVLVTMLALTAANPVAHLMRNPDVAGLLRIYSAKPVPVLLGSVFAALMIIESRPAEVAALAVITAVLHAAGTAFALSRGGQPAYLVANTVIVAWISLFYMIWRSWSSISQLALRIDKNVLMQQMKYIAGMVYQFFAGRTGSEVDRAIVTAFRSPADYAIYSIGARDIPFLSSFTSAINSVLIPEIGMRWDRREIKEVLELWKKAIYKTSLIYLPVFFFAILNAEDLIVLLFSDKYRESTLIFQVYLFHLPLRIATYGLIFQAIGKMRYLTKAMTLFLLFNAAASIALIKPIGLLGPALATVAGGYVMATYYIIHLKRFFSVPVTNLLPIGTVAKAVSFCILPFSVNIILRILIRDTVSIVTRILFFGVCFTMLYAFMLFLFDNTSKSVIYARLGYLGRIFRIQTQL